MRLLASTPARRAGVRLDMDDIAVDMSSLLQSCLVSCIMSLFVMVCQV